MIKRNIGKPVYSENGTNKTIKKSQRRLSNKQYQKNDQWII